MDSGLELSQKRPIVGADTHESQAFREPASAGRAAFEEAALRSCGRRMLLRNAIPRLIRKVRGYFRDVQRSRAELTDSVSENVLPPIPPPDGKRLR